MKNRAIFAVAFAAVCVCSHAEERVISGYANQSIIMLGSKERRYGYGLSMQFIRPEKRFAIRNTPGELVWEGYIEQSRSDHFFSKITGESPRKMNLIGALASGRYRFGSFYAEAGWGLSIADKSAYDTDSKLNSTPTVGIGYSAGKIQVALRLMHLSNGGTNGHNKGQNRLWLMVGTKF
jgi:hypothetical protein